MDIAELDIEQARRMAQVCLDLHAALGVQWGDDPYHAISLLRAKEPGSAGPEACCGNFYNCWRPCFPRGRMVGWSACREAAAKVCLGDCPGLVYKRKMNHLECATVIERLQAPKE